MVLPARLLHLADYGGPYAGSFIPMLRMVARSARASGWEMECVFTAVARGAGWLPDLAADGVEVRFAPEGGRRDVTHWLQGRLAELDGPVILHTHFTRFDLPAVYAGARRQDIAVLWHLHTFLRMNPLGFARNFVKFAWMGRRTAGIVCVSDAIADAVRRRGAPRHATTVLANGIDTGTFPVLDRAARGAARTQLDLPPGRPVLVHFAWDWEIKGGPLFAELIRHLRGRGIDVIGLTVGGGRAARAASQRLGLGDALRVCDPSHDARSYYALADAFVACSAAEGTPFSVLEALSSGIPVIATDISGHRLRPGAPDILTLAPLDPDGLADATVRVLARTPDEVDRDARQAHAWIQEHFDLTGWAERLFRIYTLALERATG